MKCTNPACASQLDLEPGEICQWTPDNFGHYGPGGLDLCAGCFWLLDTRDEATTDWARAEVAKRWPIGVDAPRRKGEARDRWIRRQARLYGERTGITVTLKRDGVGWKLGSQVFLPPALENMELYMNKIMDGEIEP